MNQPPRRRRRAAKRGSRPDQSSGRSAFTLAEAHSAATGCGFRPTQLGSRNRFSFSSAACHVGGDAQGGCWATENDGRVHFHCHKHCEGKADWLEAQQRITANLGLPEYRPPSMADSDGQPYQVREWTYTNPATGESAVQVVERYDGPCWRDDCADRFVHKHSWLRRNKDFEGKPTGGFLLLEHPVLDPAYPAEKPDDTKVIIAEGEKTAEAAAELGYKAFSYQGGSNGAERADYSPVAGLSVLIAPDNDRPGGKAALTAAVRCLEAGARDVRIMSTDAFKRRGEDLADLVGEQRAAVVERGWSQAIRDLGPLKLELSAHKAQDRCNTRTQRPLVEASEKQHLNEHVDQVWNGIMDWQERQSTPSLFTKDSRLVYMVPGAGGQPEIAEHTKESIAVLSSEAVYWYQGYDEVSVAEEPTGDDDEDVDPQAWEDAAALLDAAEGAEHGHVILRRPVKGGSGKPGRYVMVRPKPHHPQRSVTSALLSHPPEDLPELDAVMPHSFLSAKGDRLVTQPGYHPDEKVFLHNPYRFVPMDLDDAIREIDDIFGDFPFPTDADRTNLYAAMITKICRRSYAIAPMILIDKPKSGTGASLMAELVSVLTSGKMPLRATYCNGDALEFEKRLMAAGHDANGVLLMDNLTGTLVSAMLSQLLTAGEYQGRILGTSKNGTVATRNLLMMATSNNLRMAAELINRTLHIRLDAQVERPDRRSVFKHEAIAEYLLENLARKRNALLSLVHHWLEQERPPATTLPTALGRYPVWQRQTAAILEACGLRDFAANAVEFEERATADVEAATKPFMQWWWETHQGNPVKAADVADVALGDGSPNAEGMLQVNGSTDKARRINLSKFINKLVDQVFDLTDTSVRLIRGPKYANRTPTWILQEIDNATGSFTLFNMDSDPAPEEASAPNAEQPDDPTTEKGRCVHCGHPLLPDEAGPDCSDCRDGRHQEHAA